MMRRLSLVLCGILLISAETTVRLPIAHAGLHGSIRIEQISPKSLGTWTFFSTDGSVIQSTDAGVSASSYGFAFGKFGPTTLSVKAPAGMRATILIYRGGELQQTTDTPQFSTTLYPGDDYRFVVQYSTVSLGTLGVTSDPNGVLVKIKGPDRRTYSAKTPYTFKDLPAGKYAIYVSLVDGCIQLPVYSKNVEPEKRTTLHVSMKCHADDLKAQADAASLVRGQSKRTIRDQSAIRNSIRANAKLNPLK